jgi:hypothetical protein
MSDSPSEPSIWPMKLHDTLSFETARGNRGRAAGRARMGVYMARRQYRGAVPYSRFLDRSAGAERFVR